MTQNKEAGRQISYLIITVKAVQTPGPLDISTWNTESPLITLIWGKINIGTKQTIKTWYCKNFIIMAQKYVLYFDSHMFNKCTCANFQSFCTNHLWTYTRYFIYKSHTFTIILRPITYKICIYTCRISFMTLKIFASRILVTERAVLVRYTNPLRWFKLRMNDTLICL